MTWNDENEIVRLVFLAATGLAIRFRSFEVIAVSLRVEVPVETWKSARNKTRRLWVSHTIEQPVSNQPSDKQRVVQATYHLQTGLNDCKIETIVLRRNSH